MPNVKFKIVLVSLLFFCGIPVLAQSPSPLHVEGRYLVNEQGEIMNLHGFAQTYSPWFNEQNTKWTGYDVNGCLTYNKGLIDQILAAGWKMDFCRLHMDPHWSNTPGESTNGESDIHAFSFDRFKKYLDEVFVPMAEYMQSKGLYVIMRPPGVCPEHLFIGDDYQKYLIKVWEYVAQHPKLKNNGCVMFELANEPIHIYHNDGSQAGDKEISQYFQAVVNVMRKHCNNVLFVPGLGYQSQYAGFVKYPINGGEAGNIGYAIHCYPGWYNGGHGEEVVVNYADFKKGWDEQITPISNVAPVVVTEMDWAPLKYSVAHVQPDGSVWYDPRASFAFSTTGVAGAQGFGANFKKLCDDCGNVSWLLFTGAEQLAKYNDSAPDGQTFLTDWEACPRPCYRWYQEYATQRALADAKKVTKVELLTTSCEMLPGGFSTLQLMATYADNHQSNVAGDAQYAIANPAIVANYGGNLIALNEGETNVDIVYVDPQGNSHPFQILAKVRSFFPLTNSLFNPSIWETGSFNETTGELKTGQYGFGGWQYPDGIDISAFKYLVVELKQAQSAGASFRLFDNNNYWSSPTRSNFTGNQTKLVIDLHNLKAYKDDNCTQFDHNFDPSHVYIAGFWTTGGSPIYINKVYFSDDGENPTGIFELENGIFDEISREYYSLDGRRLAFPQPGVNIVKVTKNNGKISIFKVCYKK